MRHHAGAADARHQHGVGRVERGQLRLGQARQHAGDAAVAAPTCCWPSHLGAVHRDEARAEAVEAGEILVAGRLVDGALGAELGLERRHGHAVRLHAAVAAALAHGRIDEHALVGIGEQAALAPAPLLGRAGLVVEQHGHARAPRAAPSARLCRSRRWWTGMPCGMKPAGYLWGSSVTTTTFSTPSASTWLDDHRHGHAAVERLAAGHGDRVVVEDLEGHVDAGRPRRADGQAARVDVGAVAQVLEHVRGLGERRLADPVGALAAHLGEALGASGPSSAPCSGSRCRRRRASPPARRSRNCAGSRGRNRGCGWRPRPWSGWLPLRRFSSATWALMSSPAPLRISRSPSLMAMSVGSSAYLAGNSHCSFSSFLPSTRGRFGRSYSCSLTCVSISARFSSITRIRSSPSANLQHALRLERPGHADLVEADAELVGLHLVDAELVEAWRTSR